MDKVLILTVVTAVQLITQLPTLTISAGEVFTLPLSSYFQGNNVNFTLLEMAQTASMPTILSPFSMTLGQVFPYSSPNIGPSSSLGGQMKICNQEGQTYILTSYNNIIQNYALYPDGIVELLWNITLEVPSDAPVVEKMCNLTSDSEGLLYVLVNSVERIGEWGFKRHDVFVVNITDLSHSPPSPINLDIQDIRYFSRVDMEAIYGDPYLDERILVTSCTEDRNQTDQRNYLLFYNITDINSAVFLQQVIAYGDIAGHPDFVPLHTLGFVYFQETLYVLDAVVGLFSFNFVNSFFYASDFIDVVRFGTPVSVSSNINSGSLIVGTENGIVLLESGEVSLVEYMWIPTILANGNAWAPLSIQSNGRYIFTNCQQNTDTSFLLIDTLQPFGSLIQRQWRFKKLIPAQVYLPNAPYIIAHQIDPNLLFLFRSDADALRVFEMRVGTWVIQGTALETEQYRAEVLAVDLENPLNTAFSDLQVNYLPLNDTSIYLGSGYNLSQTHPVSYNFTPDITGHTAFVSLPISRLYSGPNMSFSLSFESVLEGLSLHYSPQYEKLTLESSTNIDLNSGNLVAVSDKSAYLIASNKVYIYSLRNDTISGCQEIDLGEYFGLYLALAYDRVYVLAVDNVNGNLVIIGNSVDGNWSEILENPPKGCFKVKSLYGFITCVTPSQITLYDFDLQVIESINARRMSLKEVDIVDITGQSIDYTERDIMYISCRVNGLIGVDVTYFRYYDILGSFVGIASAKQGMYLKSVENVLVQVNEDGSVLIVDIENAPAMQLIRTLPSWSTDPLQGVRYISGFIITRLGSTLYFNDFLTAVHSSLYYTMPLDSTCQFAGSDINVVLFCPTGQGSVLLQYRPIGVATDSGFLYSYNVTLGIDLHLFPWDSKEINGMLVVTNEEGSLAQAEVIINLETQGHVVIQNITALQRISSVVYTSEVVVDLSPVFSGQNLRHYININGKYPLFTPASDLIFPVVLPPSTTITSQVSLSFPSLLAFSILLLPNNITLMLTDEILQIFSIHTDIPPTWLDPQNATLIGEIDYHTLTNDTSIDRCSLLSLVYYDPPVVLVAFYCSGMSSFHATQDSGDTSYDALIIANFDVPTLNFTVKFRTILEFPPIVLKSKYDLIGGFSYILLIDSMALTASSNHLVWYPLQIDTNGDINPEYNFTVIDFYKLQIPMLCVQDADVMVRLKYGGFIYIADACFGVRIVAFKMPDGEVTGLVGGSAVGDGNDPVTSISTCAGLLFALTQSGLLSRFNLSAAVNIQPLDPIQRYNPIGRNYTALPHGLVCVPGSTVHSDSFLLGLLNTEKGEAYIRVYDLQAEINSVILQDIPLEQSDWTAFQSISGSFDGRFVAVRVEYGFKVWAIQHPYLLIPALTSENYTALETQWGGTNFTLFITAENDQMTVNSTEFYLSRCNVTSPLNPFTGSGSNSAYWWVWLLVAIVIVLSFLGISIAIRMYHKRMKDLDSGEISPSLPINEQIDSYY